MRRCWLLVVVVALVVGGCSSGERSNDELQIVDRPVAAGPAKSPPAKNPDGRVVRVDGDIGALAVSPNGGTLAVAVGAGGKHRIELRRLTSLGAAPKKLPAPGPVERIDATPGRLYATIPDQDTILAIDGDRARTSRVDGAPTSVAEVDGNRVVALREKKGVRAGEATIGGELSSADQVLAAGKRPVVVDRLRSAVFEVDVDERDVGLGLRAGQGVTNAVTDKYGRVLGVDARSGALLAFSVDPLVLRQRYPVPGRPYAIAYDAERDLAWVTLTKTNEVVGYDVGAAEPVEKHRFRTVRQPNSVTVDQRTGSVIVASAGGGGLQVIKPR